MKITQTGYSLDQRIGSFTAEIEPVFTQGGFRGAGISDGRKGKFLNYNGTLLVMKGTQLPVNFDASAYRNTGVSDGILGTRSEFDNARRRFNVGWVNPYLPSTLSFEVNRVDDAQILGASQARTQRKEKRRTLQLAGRNSKMSYRLERQWSDDQAGVLDRDFTLNRAVADHTFKWGKGSSLRTDFRLFDRQGFNAVEQIQIRESANVQHLRNLRSNASYDFSIFKTGAQRTVTHRGSYRLTHQLYSNLQSSLHARGDWQSRELSTETEYEGGARTAYNKRLFGAAVNIDVGGAYRLNDRVSEEGFINVVDEPHTIPLSGAVILERRYISLPSILVTAASDGFVLTEGIDYEVAGVGDDLTEIRIIPGGRVNPDESINVSYDYEVLPTTKFSTTLYDYRISLNWGWLRISHSDSRANETLKSAVGAGFINDRSNVSTQVNLQWQSQVLKVSMGAERRKTVNGSFRTRDYTLRQSLSYDPTRTINMNLGINQSFIKTDQRRTQLFTVEYTAEWRASRSLSVRPRVSGWMRIDEGAFLGPAERRKTSILNGGFTLAWAIRAIRLNLRYNHILRNTDGTMLNEDRVLLTLRRKF